MPTIVEKKCEGHERGKMYRNCGLASQAI